MRNYSQVPAKEYNSLIILGNIVNGTVGPTFLFMILLLTLTLWLAERSYQKAVAELSRLNQNIYLALRLAFNPC